MFSSVVNLFMLSWLVVSGLLFIVPMLNLGEHAASYYSNFLQIMSTLAATWLCLRTAQIFERNDPMRWVWIFIGAGALSWGIGQTLFTGYIIFHDGGETPYPWFSDIGFLLIQPFMVLGLLVFARAMAVRPPVWGMILAAMVLVAALGLATYTSQGNLAEAKTPLTYVVIIAYILFDPLLLAATVLSATMLIGGLLARPWWFCFGGIALYYVANRIYELENAQHTYVSGSWVDLGWVLAFILIGVAAMLTYDMLHQED